MRNFVTQPEIEMYRQLRDQGSTVRQAAATIGRSHAALHRYDLNRKTRVKATELEEAISMSIDEALAEALAPQTVEPSTAARMVEEIPSLQAKIRRLVNLVLKIIRAMKRK